MTEVANIPMTQRFDPVSNGLALGMNYAFDTFLGPMNRVEQKTDAYEFRSVDKFDRPEASRGRALHLRDTITDWWLTSKRKFWLREIAPPIFTDELHVSWSEWDTNQHFLSITPEEAASRLVTQKYMIRRASLMRYGIGVEFEHGFIKTDQGRQSFVLAVNQVAQSIVETAHMLIYRALLDCHSFQTTFQKHHNVFEQGDYIKVMKRDKDRFGVVQKSVNGLEWINADIDEEMFLYRGEADCWLLTPDVCNYIRLRRPEKTEYYRAGERGPQNVNSENINRAASDSQGPLVSVAPDAMVADVPVYIVRAMHLENVRQTELMSHRRQIGEYFTLFDTTGDYDDYTSDARTISIFNSDENRFSKLSLLACLENCHVFNQSGNVAPIENGPNGGDRRTADFLTRFNNKGEALAVEYIADIAYEYLGMKGLRKAGKSLCGQLRNKDQKQNLSTILQKVARVVTRAATTEGGTAEVVTTTLADLDTNDRTALDTFAQDVMNLLNQLSNGQDLATVYGLKQSDPAVVQLMDLVLANGLVRVERPAGGGGGAGATAATRRGGDLGDEQNTVFERNGDNGNAGSVTGEVKDTDGTVLRTPQELADAIKNGKIGAQKKDGSGFNRKSITRAMLDAVGWTGSADSFYTNYSINSSIQSKVTDAFYSMLISPAPEEHRNTLESLIEPERNALDNAQAIRNHLENMINDKVSGLRWRNTAALNEWFQRRVDQYEQKMEEMAKQQPAEPIASPVTTTQTTRSSGETIGWAAPGRRLPAGWRYVHAASANARAPRQVGTIIPGSVEQIPFIQAAMHAQESRSMGQTRASGPRDTSFQQGWAGVGRLQFAGDHYPSYDEQRRRGQQGISTPGYGELFEGLLPRFKNFGYTLEALSNSASMAIDRLCAMLYCLLPVNKSTVRNLINSNIPPPFNFVAFKPHIQYQMRFGIKLKKNGGAINMFMGKGDLQIQHSAKVKTGVLHWTGYMGAIPHTPKNVYIQGSLYAHGYDGGDGMSFWTPTAYRRRTRRRPEHDIIVAPVPMSCEHLPNPLDLTGHFHSAAARNLLMPEDQRRPHYDSAYRMNAIFGFRSEDEMNSIDEPGLRRNAVHQNTECYHGHQFMWNSRAHDFTGYRANTGHRGKDIYVGMADVWDGSKAEPLEKQDYAGFVPM